jgi:hypothetical protein
VGVLGAGEHIDPQSEAAYLPAQLAHVDVHSPRFLPAEGSKRTTMHAKDSDVSHFLRTRMRKIFSSFPPK